MQLPLQITFRDIPHSDFIEADVRQKAAKLDQFYDKIMSCHVTVESPHNHHHQGNLYHVSIDLTVPGNELVINRLPRDHQAYENAYVAIRDAFDAAKRKLQNFSRKQHKKVKHHESPPHGVVLELVPENDFGRIQSADGREIYFHRNSLINGVFDSLQVGAEVRFSEESGEQGPQASSVHIIGKHHIVN